MNPPARFSSMSRRQFLQIAGATAASVLLTACAPVAPSAQAPAAAPATSKPQRGGTLRVAFLDSVTNLDPALATSSIDVQLAWQLYENLVRRGENEEGAPLHPELAESWEMSDDAMTHTFHLRKGVTFQHGTPFTAKDVEYTINRLLDPKLGSGAGATLGAVQKVEVVDDFTVKFHLKIPNVTLPFVLGGPGAQIVPHDRTTEQLAKEAAGTGAFKVTESVPGERVVLKRNENYWDKELPHLDEVQLLTIPEPASQISALTSGTLDLIFQIGVESLAALQNVPDVVVLESKQGIYPVFVMHVADKPFDDVRVRQAFKHAVDRPALLKAMLQDRGVVGNDQPIGPNTPFWADVKPLEYNVEKAKKLLADAGYPDGVKVTLTMSEIGGPRINDTAVALQEMVKAAGITITLDKVPYNNYYADKYMKVPFFVSWWPVMSEPNGILPLAYSSKGFYNESGWSDPQLDELIGKGRGERDLAQRQKEYAEVQKMISEQSGVLIPYFASILQAARTNVKGHVPGAQLRAQFVWLAQG